jgi:hypothetical protein
VNTMAAQRRRDLHNTGINAAAAIAGQCGFTHVASGRVCHLPQRHPGPCDLNQITQCLAPVRSSHDRQNTNRADRRPARDREAST